MPRRPGPSQGSRSGCCRTTRCHSAAAAAAAVGCAEYGAPPAGRSLLAAGRSGRIPPRSRGSWCLQAKWRAVEMALRAPGRQRLLGATGLWPPRLCSLNTHRSPDWWRMTRPASLRAGGMQGSAGRSRLGSRPVEWSRRRKSRRSSCLSALGSRWRASRGRGCHGPRAAVRTSCRRSAVDAKVT